MVRMKLAPLREIKRLDFDLPARKLEVYHQGAIDRIAVALGDLGFGESLLGTEVAEGSPVAHGDDREQRRILWWVLGINAGFFVLEMVFGLISGSMGLVADSLDMLADALVYALSLLAVGGTVLRKKRLARWSGYLQASLAVFGLVEVVRRFVTAEAPPDVPTMIVVAALALVGNVATLLVLRRARGEGEGEAHVEASWIFTSNDIKVNGLVIASALVVWATASPIPDLVAGALIFVVVANGARRILSLSR